MRHSRERMPRLREWTDFRAAPQPGHPLGPGGPRLLPQPPRTLTAMPSARVRRFVRGLLSVLRIPVCSLRPFLPGDERRLDDPAREADGFTAVLTGIEGDGFLEADFVLGLHDGGVGGRFALWDWTTGFPPLLLYHLRASALQETAAKKLADELAAVRGRHPHAPLRLVGYSGGAAVAVRVFEHLPAGLRVSHTLLLGAVCSGAVDLSRVAAGSDRFDIFESPLDLPVLGAIPLLFGTTDGRHVPGAGLVGFDDPAGATVHRWRPGWARHWHLGGHFGVVNRVFVRECVAPLVCGEPGPPLT